MTPLPSILSPSRTPGWLHYFAVIWVGLLLPSHSETPAPVEDDPWAGHVVRDQAHVQGMVNARLRNAPVVGSTAPPLEVIDATSGEERHVAGAPTEKPTVLFFASFSCFCSQEAAHRVAALARRHSDRFQFYLVYVREAHPKNGWQASTKGGEFSIPDTNRLEDRMATALRFGQQHQIPFPILVDPIDDRNAVRWAAWPSRLFVIDPKGKVIYAGQQGPWFVKPTKDFDLGLEEVPHGIGRIPGYRKESLEEFLQQATP